MISKEEARNKVYETVCKGWKNDEFPEDELIDKLVFIEKVEKGLEQSERGEVYTTEQAKEMLKKWSK